ncbi:hypothetical protein NMG60_11035841 [Bertholletia excelsa]
MVFTTGHRSSRQTGPVVIVANKLLCRVSFPCFCCIEIPVLQIQAIDSSFLFSSNWLILIGQTKMHNNDNQQTQKLT